MTEADHKNSPDEPTRILLATRSAAVDGDANRERLFVLLYDELRAMAARQMGRERAGHTLTPTALVHELYIRLVDQTKIDWTDRARFYAIAARAMRQILIHHARARDAAKRGGGWKKLTLEADVMGEAERTFDTIALSDAFDALAKEDERSASVAEMRVFAGLTHDEIAHVLGVSRRTVDGDWAFARRWLSRELGGS